MPQPPMMGTWDVLVLDARPFSIHGDSYLELTIRHPQGDLTVRVPAHAWKVPPAGGDRVRLSFLMGQVTAVQAM
ncbi:MAG: hypothetical protein JWM57_1120 [Phycisphaerales bacterium]|nr:hypothetical protein [Phycisphaerales bacterium]